MTLRSTAFALAVLIAPGAVPGAAAAATLPGGAVPSGFTAVNASGGGRILDGTVGVRSSPDEAFRAGLRRARSFFGRAPHLVGVVRSTDGSTTLGLFKTTSAGVSVGGLVLAIYAANGPSRVDLMYDRVSDVDRTMRGMIARVAAIHPARAAGSNSGGLPAVHDVVSPDGSVHAVLPVDWRPLRFEQGEFAAVGPDGAEVDQEISIPCMDPSSSIANSGAGMPVPYSRDVVTAYRNVIAVLARRGAPMPTGIDFETVRREDGPQGASVAYLAGTQTLHGARVRFEGHVLVSAPYGAGGWTLTIKMVSAPVDRYRTDFPLMTAIFNSYNVDQGVRHQQVQATIQQDEAATQRGTAMMQATQARNSAVFNASMDHARSVQQSIDRSTSGFVHYLNDTTVLQGPNGRTTENANFAQSVVNGDPQHFRVVPVSEYRSGD